MLHWNFECSEHGPQEIQIDKGKIVYVALCADALQTLSQEGTDLEVKFTLTSNGKNVTHA